MLVRPEELPAGIEGLEAVGKVTREDYERTLEPLLERARREDRRIRFLFEIGPEFDGFTPGAAWEDVKVGLRSMRRFEGCAIASDVGWIRKSARLIGTLMPCPVRVFHVRERAEAIEWLRTLPEGAGVSHRLLPESGVLVAEVEEPLRAQDFDALAATADTWLEANRELRGLVIHARRFPGWKNLGGFLRHVRFVRDHHRRIERVALATDSKLAGIVPRLAEHFVHAEIEPFGYGELEAAIAWASGEACPAKASNGHGTATEDEKEYARITSEQLAKKLSDVRPDNHDPHRGYALVNVLGAEAFEREHIPGSINVPKKRLSEVESRFDSEKEVIVYCASFDCDASADAAEELTRRGFRRVVDYEGGLADWKRAAHGTEQGPVGLDTATGTH